MNPANTNTRPDPADCIGPWNPWYPRATKKPQPSSPASRLGMTWGH